MTDRRRRRGRGKSYPALVDRVMARYMGWTEGGEGKEGEEGLGRKKKEQKKRNNRIDSQPPNSRTDLPPSSPLPSLPFPCPPFPSNPNTNPTPPHPISPKPPNLFQKTRQGKGNHHKHSHKHKRKQRMERTEKCT